MLTQARARVSSSSSLGTTCVLKTSGSSSATATNTEISPRRILSATGSIARRLLRVSMSPAASRPALSWLCFSSGKSCRGASFEMKGAEPRRLVNEKRRTRNSALSKPGIGELDSSSSSGFVITLRVLPLGSQSGEKIGERFRIGATDRQACWKGEGSPRATPTPRGSSLRATD